MARGLDEEETAVDTCVLDVSVTLSSEFFPEICRVLILDVLDNRIPAIIVRHNRIEYEDTIYRC